MILGGKIYGVLAKQAVAHGAQDYLTSDHLDGYSLTRALRNAIERKAVEDALYVERDRAVVTLNSIGDAVLSTDISGNITYLNLVAEKMTGWSREEAAGRPVSEEGPWLQAGSFVYVDDGLRYLGKFYGRTRLAQFLCWLPQAVRAISSSRFRFKRSWGSLLGSARFLIFFLLWLRSLRQLSFAGQAAKSTKNLA